VRAFIAQQRRIATYNLAHAGGYTGRRYFPYTALARAP
jgi:hypothetical protein